jgi:hypothetical protein
VGNFLKANKMAVFGRNFFLSKSQLLTPEMDSMAKTKYKNKKGDKFVLV